MQNIDYTALYAENEDFKRYVDRYCVKHRISVAEALQHYLVQAADGHYLNLSVWVRPYRKLNSAIRQQITVAVEH